MWTSTSDRLRSRAFHAVGPGEAGFSLIEILLGLSLALCLALGVAPVWASLQSLGVREGDQTVWALQARVASARLERDLRLVGVQRCPFASATSVLQATGSQLVLLVASSDPSGPSLVEWELVNGSLMRRWGPCPAACPPTFAHSLYSDNKTMLENVDTAQSTFSYLSASCEVAPPVSTLDLPLLDSVGIELHSTVAGGREVVRTLGMVGR